MEVISTICALLCVLCVVLTPIAFVVWIIMLIRKSERKKKALRFFLGTLAGIVVFAIIGVAADPSSRCEHEWESIEQTTPTCTESGSSVAYCALCDTEKAAEEIPPTGHIWVETRKEATCTEQGEVFKECSVCGSTTSEVLYAQHDYVETVVSEPKCDSDGTLRLVCSDCGDKKDEAIPATEHVFSTASCTAPKTCSICGTTDGEPLGHTTDLGFCTRCDKEVRKQSPVTILGWTYTIDYVGGVEWNFRIRNNTDKQIKYVTMQWNCYNAVGDLIYDEISWKSYVRVRFTGPLDAYATSESKRNTDRFYNYNLKSYQMTEIIVEYMDGTTEKVTNYHDDVLG